MSTLKAVLAVLAILLGGSFVAGFLLGAAGIRSDGLVAFFALAIIGAIAIPLVSRLIPESDPDLTATTAVGISGLLLLLSIAVTTRGGQPVPWSAVLMSACIVLGLALGWVCVKFGKAADNAPPVPDRVL